MSMRDFLFALMVAAVLSSAIAVVHARHLHRQAYIALSGLQADRDELGCYFLHAETGAKLLFCENETNHEHLPQTAGVDECGNGCHTNTKY